MRYRNIISKPDAPTPIFPAALPAIAFLAWALILIMLAVGLLVAPTQMAYAIAILGLGTPLLWLVWHRSEFGLLGLVFLTSNFLPADTLELRLPIGGLDSRDLGLLGMLGMLLLHRAMRKRSLIFWLPIAGPLLIFLGLAIFSALYALLYRDGEFNWTLGELRTIMYYAVFFVTAWTITEQRQLVILLAGLFLLTDVIALILILQQFLGTTNPLLSVMMLGNTWLVWDAGDPTATFGGVRIIPPGHVLMYLMSIIAFCLLLFARQPRNLRLFFALQLLWINVSLLFTYARAQWIASTIALLLVTLLSSAADRNRILRYALIIMTLGALSYVMFGARLRDTVTDSPFANLLLNRVGSIFTPEETLDTYSLEWRIFETSEVVRSISEHPILGVGLGNAYREPTLLHGEASRGYFRLTRFVHNSYLYLAVKMGLLGLLAFAGFGLAFFVSSLRSYVRMSDGPYRRITLAILASFVGILIWSITQAHLLQAESTTVIGLMAGLIVCIRGLDAEADGWMVMSFLPSKGIEE